MFRYIPKFPITLIIGSANIEVLGVFQFSINVDRAQSQYILWIGSTAINHFFTLQNTCFQESLKSLDLG
jgi:hypothetical protein